MIHGILAMVAGAAQVSVPGRVVVAPYLQGGTMTSMAVSWTTDRPTTARVLVRDEAGHVLAEQSGPVGVSHRIEIDHLTPGTEYRYAAYDSGALIGVGTFHTNPGSKVTDFRFAVVGEAARVHPAAIARRVIDWKPDFVLLTASDVREVAGLVSALHPLLTRTAAYPLQSGRPAAGGAYAFQYGDARFFALGTVDPRRPIGAMGRLKSTLRESTSPWKCAYLRLSGAADLGRSWGDLLKRDRVRLVFADGASANRWKPEGGVWTFYSGNQARTAGARFIGVTMAKDEARIEAIDETGRVVERASVRR